jgi:hypothetical protein
MAARQIRHTKVSHMKIRLIATVVLLSFLAGCVANPYSKVILPAQDKLLTATTALSYSNAAMEDFRSKRSAEFDRQQNLSGSLFLLGATSLALGAYGAHKDAITGTALLGATTYQMGIWNTNAGRNALYSEGINALACAQIVMTPVLVDEAALTRVRNKMVAVQLAWEATARASGEIYDFSISTSLTAEVRAALQVERVAADKQINRADRAVGRAERYLALSDRAPGDLKTHVDVVRESVDNAMTGTLADIRELQDINKRLADYSIFFGSVQPQTGTDVSAAAPVSNGTPSTATTESGGEKQRFPAQPASRIANLIAATNALRGAVTALDNAYARTSSGSVKADMVKCKIDPSSVELQVNPESLNFTAGVTRESLVDIVGGTGFYRVRIDTVENGPVVTQPATTSFSIKITDKTPAATYTVRVEDSTSRSATLTLLVAAKPAIEKISDTAPLTCAPDGRSQTEICLAQQVLGVAMDGNFGEATCKAFRGKSPTSGQNGIFGIPALEAIKASAGLAKDASEADIKAKLKQTCPVPKATPARVVTVPATDTTESGIAASPPTGPCAAARTQNTFECSLTADQVKALRTTLSLAPVPVEFDYQLREKLAIFQRDKGLLPKNGIYTPQTKAALFGK